MPDKPRAEAVIDEDLIRRLLTGQASELIPDAATRPLAKVAEGWDCELWLLGDGLAARLPRRALAAPLILNEQRVLPAIARRVEPASGLRLPVPVLNGRPASGYPWSWSIVPWFDGTAGLSIRRSDRSAWAMPLARALLALHAEAPADHPVNPVRGVPLAIRNPLFTRGLASLAGRLPGADASLLRRRWDAALEADPWTGRRQWIHGDLHPGNLIALGSRLVAIIDFGDVTAGDPAYDLAVAWTAFDATGRAAFVAATADRYDEATWVRARGWAAATAVMLLDQSDDNPAYAALGADIVTELAARPPAR